MPAFCDIKGVSVIDVTQLGTKLGQIKQCYSIELTDITVGEMVSSE